MAGNATKRRPSPGPRRPFKPRDPRRATYYRMSILAGSVFVVLAALFPLWIDYAKKKSDMADFEAARRAAQEAAVELSTPRPEAAAAAVQPEGTQGGPVGATKPLFNVGCASYVSARCNALDIPSRYCGAILAKARKVPVDQGMDGCRKAVQEDLDEARQYVEEQPAGEEAPAEAAKAPAQAEAGGPGKAAAVEEGGKEESEAAGKAKAKKAEPPRLGKEEKAANLARIYTLVEELQRASLNYATLPAAQQARFMELKSRVEADGSPRLKKLYNTLLQRYGRTAGYETTRPGTRASESRVEQVEDLDHNPRTTTPELENLGRMVKESGGALPATTGSARPLEMEPSQAQAPPALEP